MQFTKLEGGWDKALMDLKVVRPECFDLLSIN
jgi:hypothetical protein